MDLYKCAKNVCQQQQLLPQVSRLNLPQFLPPPEASSDSVSYRNEARRHIKPLNFSALQSPNIHTNPADHVTATFSAAQSGSARSNPHLPAISGFTALPVSPALALDNVPGPRSLYQQHSSRHEGSHQTHSPAIPGIVSGPMQTSRLIKQPTQTLPSTAAKRAKHKSPAAGPAGLAGSALTVPGLNLNKVMGEPWQYPAAAASAHTAQGQKLSGVAGESWQSIATADSAHEQWVMRRQAARARIGQEQEEELWGQLTVQLPSSAILVPEHLLQQLPEELHETAQLCSTTAVSISWRLA